MANMNSNAKFNNYNYFAAAITASKEELSSLSREGLIEVIKDLNFHFGWTNYQTFPSKIGEDYLAVRWTMYKDKKGYKPTLSIEAVNHTAGEAEEAFNAYDLVDSDRPDVQQGTSCWGPQFEPWRPWQDPEKYCRAFAALQILCKEDEWLFIE